MDFSDRLDKAITRGQKRGDARKKAAAAKTLSEDEARRMHTDYRLSLSEHIEKCIEALPSHFPGFSTETIYGEAGWGAACRRDDLSLAPGGRRATVYSRLEMTVRPFSSAAVLELTAKGTIRNKEVFNRKHFERVGEADIDTFRELVDLWVLDFAELFAASE